MYTIVCISMRAAAAGHSLSSNMHDDGVHVSAYDVLRVTAVSQLCAPCFT